MTKLGQGIRIRAHYPKQFNVCFPIGIIASHSNPFKLFKKLSESLMLYLSKRKNQCFLFTFLKIMGILDIEKKKSQPPPFKGLSKQNMFKSFYLLSPWDPHYSISRE